MVEQFAVAHAIAGARLQQQVGSVGHGLKAASDGEVAIAAAQAIGGHHHGLHARAAHLVDSGGRYRIGDAGLQRRLSCRGLALAGGQHATHDDFVHQLRRKAAGGERTADGGTAELGSRSGRQHTLEAADGRALGGENDDGFSAHDGVLGEVVMGGSRSEGGNRLFVHCKKYKSGSDGAQATVEQRKETVGDFVGGQRRILAMPVGNPVQRAG